MRQHEPGTEATHGGAWRRGLGHPYALLVWAMLFWSGNWVTGRAVRDLISPIAFNFWRWAITLAILLPLTLPGLWRQRGILLRRWPYFLVMGIAGVSGFHTLVYSGLARTSAVNAVLINAVLPLTIVATSWLVHRETVSLRQVAGMVLSLGGVATIVVRGDPALLFSLQVNAGDFLILAALGLFSLYAVLLRHRPPELPPLVLLTAFSAYGLLSQAPLYAWDLYRGHAAGVAWSAPGLPLLGAILYVAVFASVGAYLCWNAATAALGPNRAGPFVHLLPLFTTILAVLLLGESLHAYHGLAVLLIFSGIALATLRPARRGASEAKEPRTAAAAPRSS